MEGHELAQSHHKATLLVGLAIDAIGLRFQVQDARRFTKAGRQHLFAEERLATTTVNYGCAADGLSGAGGEASEMTRFAEVALNPKGTPLPAGALSIAGAVNRVYREGRNKLAHDETAGLLEDHSEIRSIGDSLLTNLFDVVTVELAAVIDNTSSQILAVKEDHAYRALKAKLKACV